MNSRYEQTLKNLAETLVTPERFGAVALTEVQLELPKPKFPELHRIHQE